MKSQSSRPASGFLILPLLAVALLPFHPQASAEWGGVGGLSTPPPAPVLVPTASDTDGDGMPNVWKTANSLNPSNPKDARSDFDMDDLPAIPGYTGTTYPSLIAAANDTVFVSVNGTRI